MSTFVTLVNRTERVLEGTWDGRPHVIEPGENAFPELEAQAFKRQNPIRGTMDPSTGISQCLLGIKENGDNCDPISAEEEAKLTQDELFNRALMPGGNDKVIVINNPQVGLYNPKADANYKSLPMDTAFVDPKGS